MADVLKIFLIVVGVLTMYVAYWLVAHALFPNVVERARHQYSKPIKITLIGFAAAFLPVIAGGAISKLPNPLVKLLGLTLMVVPMLLGLVGSAGLALRIGAGLPSVGDDQQPWRRVLRGGVLLALTFLLPFVGWIVISIWTLVSGFGAFLFAAREPKASTPAPTPMLTSVQGTVG